MKTDSRLIQPADLEIAIIGMAGRFPGAKNVDEYWNNLRAGVESISFFTREELIEAGIDPAIVNAANYVRAAPMLDDPALFDATFFNYASLEAQFIDPQQRLFLECAWEALEHAGYDVESYDGAIGVYAGSAMNTYLLFSGLLPHFTTDYVLSLCSNDKDFLTTRVSYKLNLTGPSITIQTACSTSLVAVHLACQSLLDGECDMALAGGVSVRVPHKAGYLYQEGSIFSPDGHCRPFDARAQGTIFGSGVAIIVLKRLADAIRDRDCIHAVIKGSAINNDGAAKISYTAPSVERQSEVIVEALANAGVEAGTISYIEAHGTGTELGDPIEVAALTKAFRTHTDKRVYCAMGSVKSNIGHLDAAAGVAGLLKTVLALKHRMIPPSLHYEAANPEIDFANSPFYVNSRLATWENAPGMRRRAGVSALGVGGTNAHVILEEAPEVEESGPSRECHLLVLSARNREVLDESTRQLAQYLEAHPKLNLADVAYTLQVGRKSFDHRRAVVCEDRDNAVHALKGLDPKRIRTSNQAPVQKDIAFMFPGQGAQYVNMGLQLYQAIPAFREEIDRCSEILQSHLSLNLRDILFSGEKNAVLNQTFITQPALFAVEYALAQWWISLGLQPSALIGHSIGEYVAACLAEVFSLEDALKLVTIRGRLMQELAPGSMLTVHCSESEIQPLLSEKVSLASVNGPTLCVVSGELEAVADIRTRLSEQKVDSRYLNTSHAFHSVMMEPILESFIEYANQLDLKPPIIPFVSNVTGTWITSDEAVDPGYWAKQARRTVRLADGIGELLSKPDQILLEVGPGQTLSTLVQLHPQRTANQLVLSSMPHALDTHSHLSFLLQTLSQLWLSGTLINWPAYYDQERRRRLVLPTYPFQRQRYWMDDRPASRATGISGNGGGKKNPPSPLKQHILPRELDESYVESGNWQRTPAQDSSTGSLAVIHSDAYAEPTTPIEAAVASVWQEVLGLQKIGIHDNFFRLGGHSVLILQIVGRLNQMFQMDLPMLSLIESPNIAGVAQRIEAVYCIERGQTASLLS